MKSGRRVGELGEKVAGLGAAYGAGKKAEVSMK